ncbi:MAG: hypothetical protein ACM3X1_07825 [Ignavibacteriales bacterium]
MFSRFIVRPKFSWTIITRGISKLVGASESFSELESFQNPMNGESGSIEEEVGQTPVIVSYYPVEALQNRWAVLWMQPIGQDLMDIAMMTTSDLNSASAVR